MCRVWWPLIGFFIGFVILLCVIGFLVNLKPDSTAPRDSSKH